MMTLMVVAVLAASPGEAAKTSAEVAEVPPQWAVQLHVDFASMLNGGVRGLCGSLGGIGVFLPATPPVGLAAERVVKPRWTVSLGLDAGGAALEEGFSGLQLEASAGLRYYVDDALRGAWFGAQVGVGAQQQTSVLAPGDTISRSFSRLIAVTPAFLLGWTLQLDHRFLLTVAAGPTVTWARLSSGLGSGELSVKHSLGTGVSAFAAIGFGL